MKTFKLVLIIVLMLISTNVKSQDKPYNIKDRLFKKQKLKEQKNKIASSDNYVIKNVPLATTNDLLKWLNIMEEMQGVEAFDPKHNKIYYKPAEKTGLPSYLFLGEYINNWYPLADTKRTLCGELYDYRIFDGDGDEMDWNFFITPNPKFSYLVNEALPYKSNNFLTRRFEDIFGGWHSKVNGKYIMEAEITSHKSFQNNVFFPKRNYNPVIPLEGRDLCVYGPWVRERVHGNRPEIHPSEMIWWKENNMQYLMLIQDDSNRFDSDGDFDLDGDLASDWKPWAAPALTAQFKIAFEVDPSRLDKPLIMSINEVYNRFVVTSQDSYASRDADNGKLHALVINNKIVLKVNELQVNDNDLGIKFVEVRKRSNGKIQGYVQITTKVGGTSINGDEGYHILSVRTQKATSTDGVIGDIQAFAFNKSFVKPVKKIKKEWDFNSLRVKKINGVNNLILDLNLTNTTKVKVSKPTNFPKSAINSNRNFKHKIQGLPVFKSTKLEATSRSNKRVTIENDKLSISGFLNKPKGKSKFNENRNVQNNFNKVLNIKQFNISGKLGMYNEYKYNCQPFYLPEEGIKNSYKRKSKIANYLNEKIVSNKGAEIKSVYKNNNPFTFKWNFTAINLVSKETVKVNTSHTLNENEIRIQLSENNYQKDEFLVSFPNDGNVYQLKTNVEITDIFGNKTTKEYILLSHLMKVVKNDKTVDELLNLALGVKKTLKANDIINQRKRESLRLLIFSIIEDEIVSINEFKAIIKAGKNI